MTAVGEIADFSSRGPTIDGRTKPDITAPGNIIVSAVSSYDSNFSPSADRTVGSISNGTNTWYFGALEETSMATPMVTGVVALLLEAYPDLTPDQVKELLKDDATTDSFTVSIPSSGDNTWGWEKVDALNSLLTLESNIPAKPTVTPSGNVAICQGETQSMNAPTGFANYEWSKGGNSQSINATTAGNYSVKVENSDGYWSEWSDTTVLTVNTTPPTPTISQSGAVLTSSATSGNQWYLDGAAISGATNQTHTALVDGNYKVEVTNSSNCSAESSELSVTHTPTSLLERSNAFKIIPNPANDRIQIISNEQLRSVQILNVQGQLIKEANTRLIDINELSKGVYFLNVQFENSSSTTKLLVE